MISFTAKLTKPRIFTGLAILLIPFLIFAAVYIAEGEKPDPAVLTAKTKQQRQKFLEQYGWQVDMDEETEKDTVIPAEFDNVYTAYNNIQLTQGFDLEHYKGKNVKLYSIKVNNYPENSEFVFATLLVYNGTIIGGDIHSTELGGFMHGFSIE